MVTNNGTATKKPKKKNVVKSFIDTEAVDINDESGDELHNEEFTQSDDDFINDNDSD